VVRIPPLKDRALGIADAQIVIDRAGWLALSQRQRDALVDHELTHLTRKIDKETGEMLVDILDRPKLVMRKHDHQHGWFDEIAQRHGEASPEVRQARRLIESSGQLYFDFEPTIQDQAQSNAGQKIPAPTTERPKGLARTDIN
jgi:Putative phage metallopeptidase